MNPKFKELKQAKITTRSSKGEYTFVCSHGSHGHGRDAYVLKIEGIGLEPDLSDTQFLFDFNGEEYGASIEILGWHDKFCKVRLSTIVSHPEFWT